MNLAMVLASAAGVAWAVNIVLVRWAGAIVLGAAAVVLLGALIFGARERPVRVLTAVVPIIGGATLVTLS